MKRYFITKYGQYLEWDIPAVIKSGDLRVENSYPTRNKDYEITGDILVIKRINRYNTKEFVKTITTIRNNFWDKIIYLPATGMIFDYPILFYMGIDILDDLPLRIIGNSRCITEFGLVNGINCFEFNMREKERMMIKIRMALENFRFRELVEAYSMTSFSKEALRIMDMAYFEEMKPLLDFRERPIKAANIESIYRPEIQNFRDKVLEMKQTSSNLLLIPCSAVKPYSKSKTHRVLHSFIYSYLNGLQEVIVTSPLGLVPRELENFFPVKNYDIPVTGYWFEEEKKMLFKLAENYFRNKKYEHVFFILDSEESEIIKLFENAEGIEGKLNYENAERLFKIMSPYSIKGNRSVKRKIEFANIIKYQYDIDLSPSEIELSDEGNRSFAIKGREKLIKKTVSGITMEIGLGKILQSMNLRTIEVSGRFTGGNIYVPGIISISKDVRPGNEVVLTHNGEVIGRGISELSYIDLKFVKNGIGVSNVSYFKL